MILDLPQSDVPNFCALPNWPREFDEWLEKRGLCYIEISLNAEEITLDPEEISRLGYHIINGDVFRGSRCEHSVVGFAGKMIADPHPSDAGLIREKSLGLFVVRFADNVEQAGSTFYGDTNSQR
jgi:hypothetical protein